MEIAIEPQRETERERERPRHIGHIYTEERQTPTRMLISQIGLIEERTV